MDIPDKMLSALGHPIRYFLCNIIELKRRKRNEQDYYDQS